MIETSARLLRLLSLLQMRRYWSGLELAERLEVTARTLRRDIARLRELGYPIDGTAGVAGGYQLGAGASLPPLTLEDDEALAVSISLRTAASHAASGMEEAALRALVKLERVLPVRLRRRASALRSSIIMLDHGGEKPTPDTLQRLATACDELASVSFEYRDREGKSRARETEPVGLVHNGFRWYLVAWDRTRDDWRTFRVDRIVGELTVGARFAPRPPPHDGDLRGYVSGSVSATGNAYRAHVILHAPLEAMRARINAHGGELEALDDERCALRVGTASLAGLSAWIVSFGVDFEVVEPAELVEHLRALRDRVDRACAAA